MKLNEIVLGDCMDVMRGLPDGFFELAITDPPYGISEPAFRRGAKNKLAKNKDYHNAVFKQDAPDDDYFNELFRVSKNQIIWGGNYYGLPGSRCWIVWDKDTKDTQWADAELAWTSFNTSVRIVEYRWNGMLQQDMKNKETRIQPTQKPVGLYKWLLQNYAKPGDKILDTHSGSGSLALACDQLGFDFLAIELDPDYHAASCKRLQQQRNQLRLFA